MIAEYVGQSSSIWIFRGALKETLNKSGPALLDDLNLIRETTSHDFPA